jgi:hypothetical protein
LNQSIWKINLENIWKNPFIIFDILLGRKDMKINFDSFRLPIFFSVIIILLLFTSSESFAYDSSVNMQYKIVKPLISVKTTHKISFIYTCDQGEIKSLTLRVYQLNIKGGGIDKTIVSSPSNPTQMLLLLPDGGYIGSATGHVKTKSSTVFVEGQITFSVNGKDQSFTIKLKPLEGMS